jgi:hypothetical protein
LQVLDKPIPDVPFPNGNGIKAFDEGLGAIFSPRMKVTIWTVLL